MKKQLIGEELLTRWTPRRIFLDSREALNWVFQSNIDRDPTGQLPLPARRGRRVKIVSKAWFEAAEAMAEETRR